ncbi:MAG: DUF4175 family protein [Flavobacteriales bacterium]
MSSRNILFNKLEEFISKYYKNLLLKGGIYFLSISLASFILLSTVEYFGEFDRLVRGILFWLFILTNSFIFWKWIVQPLFGLYRLGRSLSHKEAAKIIGNHFSSVQDQLINILQLQELSEKDNALVEASIEQKVKRLQAIPFASAIDLKSNLAYLKYVIIPIVIVCLLFFTGNKDVIVDSSSRIASYNTEFLPVAPFQFILENEELMVIKGNDLMLNMRLKGSEIPKNAKVVVNGMSYNMLQNKQGHFSYLFKTPQESIRFQFLANGFFSENYSLKVIPKPVVLKFTTELVYPKYTGRQNEILENIGNLEVPKGTRIKWLFETKDSEDVFVRFDNISTCKKQSDKKFMFSKQVSNSSSYSVFTKNDFITGDSISYKISAVADVYPNITIKETVDSINPKQRFFEGYVEDDYGLSRLTFNYLINSKNNDNWQSTDLLIPANKSYNFFESFNFDDYGIDYGQEISYYFEVWDNDGFNGSKASRSKRYSFKNATIQELEEESEQNNEKLKQDIEESKSLAEQIQKELEKLQEQLLKDKTLGWDEKQKAKDLIDKQEALKQKVDNIRKQQEENNLKENNFKKPDEDLIKKQEEIQRLFDNIMDEEMNEMLNELKEMMDDINKEDLKEALENMQKSDEDIEKELDRTLELFKQMEVQQKIEQNINKLNELSKQQDELAGKRSEEKEKLKEEQLDIESQFEDIQKDLEKAQELNEKLENKQTMPSTKSLENMIKEDIKKSLDKLNKNMKKQAAKNQENAADKMQEMSQSLQSALQSAQQEQIVEDMQTLRQILENLVTLSLDQENILKSITEININSPIFLDYLQLQNKLQADAQIIEDSLFALSKRQPQIQSIVNSEINTINLNMQRSLEEMSERRSKVASEKQQFAMTSANNLALILSETLEQMQKEMANISDKPSSKMCNKPKSGGEGMKKMKQMQNQVKDQMKQMLSNKKKGKMGKGSKGLAQLAAKQEMIRNRMSELREELSNDLGSKQSIDKLIRQMEENEVDIINDNITLESLKRQQSIMTRLLEAEKAQMERDEEKTRESTEWLNNLSNRLVNPFEDYQKEKAKQEELLKTIPPTFKPFYKEKVRTYFKNINGQ